VASHDPKRRRWEAISAERGKETLVQRSISLEARLDVVPDAVMPADFGQQLVNEARDLADTLDRALLAQMRQRLRLRDR
jgi:hypothetical protein